GEEGGEVVGVVVDVIGRGGLGRDMDGTHPKRVRHGEIAGIVLEHGAAGGVEAVLAEDGGKGKRVGRGVELGVLDPVDRIEEVIKPPGGKDFFGVGGAGVGVDDLAAGKQGDGAGEVGIGRKHREVDVMHLVQVGAGVDVVFAHQARKRGAV